MKKTTVGKDGLVELLQGLADIIGRADVISVERFKCTNGDLTEDEVIRGKIVIQEIHAQTESEADQAEQGSFLDAVHLCQTYDRGKQDGQEEIIKKLKDLIAELEPGEKNDDDILDGDLEWI